MELEVGRLTLQKQKSDEIVTGLQFRVGEEKRKRKKERKRKVLCAMWVWCWIGGDMGVGWGGVSGVSECKGCCVGTFWPGNGGVGIW